MTCDDVRISLGVYILGALDPEETAEVEAHLDGCPACRAELAELSGLPQMLARVSEEDIDRAARPPRAVLDRLVVASARRNRRSRILLALAASVVVAALGGTAWLGGTHTVEQSTAAAPASAAAGSVAQDSGVDAPMNASVSPDHELNLTKVAPSDLSAKRGNVRLDVRLTAEEGGTRVIAQISGVPVGTRCSLLAIDRDGTVSPVGSWSVRPGDYSQGKTSFEGSTALQVDEIQRFALTTADGHTLVNLRL